MEFNFDTLLPYVISFAITALIASYFYEKKRTEALQLKASSLGFSFSKKGRDKTAVSHCNFELFSKGHGRKIKNEMWNSSASKDVSIFGYNYIQRSGDNSTTYKQTVLSIKNKKLNIPKFTLQPENAFHKIGQVFGYQDVDFESFPDFSKKYLLRGNNESQIRALFTPEVIRFFEKNQDIHIEGQGSTLIFYRPSHRCKPDEIKDFYQNGQTALSYFG